MIRSALIALGLGAGAASALFFGANAARAQGLVRAAPIVEVCGGTRAELTEACGAGEVGGTPIDPSHDDVTESQAVDVIGVTIRTATPVDAAVTPDVEHSAMQVSLRCGAVPFHRDLVFQGIMDGSDPSADFCP